MRQPRSALPTLEEVRAERARRSLEYFVPWATPGYLRPTHLRPLTEKLERFEEEPFLLCGSAPPRHTKTETCFIHFAPWVLKRWPKKMIGYVTHSATVAEEKNIAARAVAERIGLRVGRVDRQDMWLTPEGGGVRALGVGGSIMGRGFDILIVDDPYANNVEAESPHQREQLRNWFRSTLFTRREPGGSIIVFHQRWNDDDLIATLTGQGWPYINLPALGDAGEPLWPERWPAHELATVRDNVGEYYWASQYMGQPRPRGLRVFHGVHTYTKLPDVYRVAIGVDLAYSKKSSADYSGSLVLLEANGLHYVADVQRMQVEAPEFKRHLAARAAAYPGAPMRWHCAGTEKGAADFIREGDEVPLQAVPATADKFIRAQSAAAAWNAGKILVPADAPPWLQDFIRELHAFTGVKDVNDDQVDMLSSAFEAAGDSTELPEVQHAPPTGLRALDM